MFNLIRISAMLFTLLGMSSCTIIVGEAQGRLLTVRTHCSTITLPPEPGPPEIPSTRYGDDRFVINQLAETVKLQKLYIDEVKEILEKSCGK